MSKRTVTREREALIDDMELGEMITLLQSWIEEGVPETAYMLCYSSGTLEATYYSEETDNEYAYRLALEKRAAEIQLERTRKTELEERHMLAQLKAKYE